VTAHRRAAGRAHRTAALERPDQRDGLGDRLPWQRSQREGDHGRGEDGGRRDHGGMPRQAQPPGQRARRRGPELFARGAERRLQPRRHRTQPAQRPAGHRGEPGHDPGDGRRVRPGQPGADPLQAIAGGLYGVRFGVQGAAQQLSMIKIGLGHAWLFSALRSADMPRAVWLLTAPVVMPMIEAICPADRSA